MSPRMASACTSDDSRTASPARPRPGGRGPHDHRGHAEFEYLDAAGRTRLVGIARVAADLRRVAGSSMHYRHRAVAALSRGRSCVCVADQAFGWNAWLLVGMVLCDGERRLCAHADRVFDWAGRICIHGPTFGDTR